MTDLAARLAALTPQQRAEFERLLRESGRTENAFPLSPPQQGVWFLEQLRPGNRGYVVPAAALLDGPLDVTALRAAVDEIVRRHEALRTTFQLRDGRPVQVVADRVTVELPVVELPGANPRGAVVREEIARAAGEPFDLTTGPLLRLRLLRISADRHVLAVAMHHLVSDGWSVGVLLAELSALYPAFVRGQRSPLPELAVQYGDFAVWQQEQRARGDLDDGVRYWREHLAGAPSALALPTDAPRPAVQGFAGATTPVQLSREAFSALTALGRRHGATPYMALLAVVSVLLGRHSGQDDVVVGMPTAGRDRAEVEPLIGFFVNTVPVRTELGGHPTFVEVLRRVRTACLGAYAHADVPLDRIVEVVAPERDLSRPPVFQVCLTYQSDPMPRLELAGLSMQRLPVTVDGARFDLELQLFEDDGAVAGWLEYDRDLFAPRTAAGWVDHLQRLVELVVAAPDRPVDRLPLLGPAERAAVLAGSSGPSVEWPGRGWIHECFVDQARATPDAVAVRFEGVDVSYAELERRTRRLAARLRRLGVGRDVAVGVALHRSIELVVSLYAVVRAGGAYVPLDPGHPPARLAAMMQDARLPVLLTDSRLLGALPPVDAQVLCLDEPADAPDGDEPAVDPALDGEDPAYVIFTSGSTGRPKGVVTVHAAIRSRLLWMQDAFPLGPGDRVLQKTPFSFDVSVWEFFWPLMVGATLVVARPEGHRDPAYLVDLIRSEQITTLHFVPSMLRVLLAEPGLEECTGVRRVVCSGEALPRDLQQDFFARSGAELHNLYGPTEAAVDVSWWECRRDGDPRPVPIGRPIANTTLLVLDRALEPVPTGVVGELYIGGRNLARGYLHRVDLTADRFVPDPHGGAPGARLYRTGDLARYRADGALEYLGRTDHQVKLRGFRVEPGEIEAVLAEHPAVRDALVLAVEPRPGDVRLVGYVTGEDDPGPAELSALLRARLPEHMVPAAFVHLPVLPLTPNGKADRAALPLPDLVRPARTAPHVAPRDALEQTIADVWREVLGVDQVGVDDSFFDLGGTSLQVATVRLRLVADLGREISMVDLFHRPTVAALAAHLAADPADAGASGSGVRDARERGAQRRRTDGDRRQAAARRTTHRSGRRP